MRIEDYQRQIREFCEARDWDQFHNAKDLAIGISTEAGELLDHFRFKSPEEAEKLVSAPENRREISDELADIFYFVLRFAQQYDIDLGEAFKAKMAKNEAKYPVEKAKGSNRKYTEARE